MAKWNKIAKKVKMNEKHYKKSLNNTFDIEKTVKTKYNYINIKESGD